MPFAHEDLLAVQTLALLFHILSNLALGHGLLDAGQHLLGLREPESKRFWRELISLEASHFLNTQRRSLLV